MTCYRIVLDPVSDLLTIKRQGNLFSKSHLALLDIFKNKGKRVGQTICKLFLWTLKICISESTYALPEQIVGFDFVLSFVFGS